MRSLCQHVSRKRDEMGKADLGSVLLGVKMNGEDIGRMVMINIFIPGNQWRLHKHVKKYLLLRLEWGRYMGRMVNF